MSAAEQLITEFAFELAMSDKTGEVVGRQRLKPADFGHAIRHTSLDAFRQGAAEAYYPLSEGARIEPLFADDSSSSPEAEGFVVTIPLSGGRTHCCQFPVRYFASSAIRFRAALVRAESLAGDQELRYRLHAFLDEQRQQPANKLAISLAPATCSIPAAGGRRRDFGPAAAWGDPHNSDLPVIVDDSVLHEAVDEARENPEREVAGFLLGKLVRDLDCGEVFVVVSGLVSAAGTTESSSVSVTFTPHSFAHVRSIIKLRASGESIVGWYHSHPFKLCAECPLPTPPECIAKVLFYSQDDIHLMETTFEQPFMIGLLAAIEPRIEQSMGHLPVSLYGWRNGEIAQRGFEVVDAAGSTETNTPV